MTEHARFGGGSSTITFNSPLTAAAGSFTTLTATTSGSAGSPSLNLGSNSGLYDGSPTTLRLAVNGTQLVSFFGGVSNNRGIVIRDDVGEFQIGSGSIDVRLGRDAANTLSLKNTTNPQTFNIYNTFTSATNHERGFLKWSSNVFQIGTEAGSGGGTVRNVDIRVGTQSSGAVFSAAGSGMQLSLRNVTTTSTSSLAGITLGSGHDIVLSTTTGTKIGTATNQLLGFFNAAPVAQQAAVADATDAASTQARLNDLLARLRTLGLIAT
jgi:hypothetical protein